MKIKIVQEFIDLLRLKETKNITDFSSNFLDRIKIMIKSAVPYLYEEKKLPLNYMPQYNNKVKVDTSIIRNLTRYRKAIKKLKLNYDIKGLEYTYNNLSDEFSKEMFLNIITYQLFDDVKLRFPIYYSNYFDNLCKIKTCLIKSKDNNDYGIYDLNPLGFDLQYETSSLGVHLGFLQEQYNYRNQIQVEEGDIVIDGGACFGDASLYFSFKNKNKGKVYSFEFIDDNIKGFNNNINLNPKYKNNIVLVEHPIWSNSEKSLFCISNGPGSFVSEQNIQESKEVKSISIDDFVKDYDIKKVDFIKFDIEGSELEGLIGAQNTIKTFKPKLAICIYHKKEDLWEIPKYIKELVPNYELYINHHSINLTESVLYAKYKNDNELKEV